MHKKCLKWHRNVIYKNLFTKSDTLTEKNMFKMEQKRNLQEFM